MGKSNQNNELGRNIAKIVRSAIGALNHTHIGYSSEHDYMADSYVDDIMELVAFEIRKARSLPRPIKSTSDIRCGNSRPLKEREIVMKAYNKCLRDIAKLEREEQ